MISCRVGWHRPSSGGTGQRNEADLLAPVPAASAGVTVATINSRGAERHS
jgi:hypothetical protein